MNSGNWDTPATDLAIHPSEVHIWRAGLALPEHALGELAATLADDEELRSSRFRFEMHRKRFVAGRAILRSIIGRYLTCDPAEIRFEYGAYGKPKVAFPRQGPRLDFNLAHSGELALFAFCLDRKIGVDIERERFVAEMPQLVSRNFSAREAAAWRSLPPGERQDAFFNCWVRKEAFVKAVGEGLSYPLQDFDVSLLPGETPDLQAVCGDVALAKKWSLLEVDAAAGYAAAVVVEGSGWKPHYLQFG